MTSDQGHRNDITNGQRVSRHSLPTQCFLFFPHPHFLKTILCPPASGTFGFARHTSPPFAKPKEPLFSQRHNFENNVNETHQNNIFGKMNSNRDDILLEELIEIEWLSVRSINICKDAGLISLIVFWTFIQRKVRLCLSEIVELKQTKN